MSDELLYINISLTETSYTIFVYYISTTSICNTIETKVHLDSTPTTGLKSKQMYKHVLSVTRSNVTGTLRLTGEGGKQNNFER